MAYLANRLTAMEVRNAKPGTHQDGLGLALRVEPTGSARWFVRVSFQGRRRDVGIGSRNAVGLAQARQRAQEIREMVAAGVDPAPRKGSAVPEAGPMTFATAAGAVLKLRMQGLSNAKHKAQWASTLETYAYPLIGKLPVAGLSSSDVLGVLTPIWLTKAETARRVRQRIKVVLDWSVAAGHRGADLANAATACGPGLPKQPVRRRHHAAMPWKDVPDFIQQIRTSPSAPAVRLALELLILTAARTSEVIESTWPEFDLESGVWAIPPERMKARVEHRIPLSSPALAVLRASQRLWPTSRWVFPGQRAGEHLSNMALLMLVRKLTGSKTTHGFRSSFRDWSADHGHAREIAEAALAHSLPRVEAAYRRSDLLGQRRALMQAWAAFCAPS